MWIISECTCGRTRLTRLYPRIKLSIVSHGGLYQPVITNRVCYKHAHTIVRWINAG